MPKVPNSTSPARGEEATPPAGLACQRSGQGHPHVAFTVDLDKAVTEPLRFLYPILKGSLLGNSPTLGSQLSYPLFFTSLKTVAALEWDQTSHLYLEGTYLVVFLKCVHWMNNGQTRQDWEGNLSEW